MAEQKLAVLIPIFNGLNFTKESLKTLKNSLIDSKWEINTNIFVVVIDDGSTDGSADWIKLNYPETIICKGNGDLWWSGAINLGSHYSFVNLNCSYVLLWNNDIRPDVDYFKNLYNIVYNDKIVPVFGSKIYIENTNHIWFMGGVFDSCTGRKFMTGHNQPDSGLYNTVSQTDWLTGMGTVIHKSVIEKIGFWDAKNFPQYHGDSDFTLRAKKAGFPVVVFPELKIWNDISNTGIYHKKSYKQLKQSLISIKSDFNFKKDLLFYKLHSTCFIAYSVLFMKYFRYIGGFVKQKYFHKLKP